MPLEKTGDILRHAYTQGYGVAAFNIFNYETIHLAIQEAENQQKPVIIGFYPVWQSYISLDVVSAITHACAKTVGIPVGLHLDHCDDFAVITKAMQIGFSSVMYDGSHLPFDENVKNTQNVVKAAHALGIDVEAELGAVGDASNIEDFADRDKFTTVEQAIEFYEKTNCNSLAVAVGNAHGNYIQEPTLDLPRIEAISKALNIPLVLHGGSGIPDDQVQEAVKRGIAKMNVATEYHHAYYLAVKEYMQVSNTTNMYNCANDTQTSIREFLACKINLLHP
ncbi:MAG: class II fructose-bisphosphate aldolase [Oscillospiraceae bacterium]|nr:class II fructose-bisphosphate aldolase [Oscillospiraceae bacterium]